MADMVIYRIREEFYVSSWTFGCKKSQPPSRTTEDSVMAEAMWLVQHGKSDEAEMLIERWCQSKVS